MNTAYIILVSDVTPDDIHRVSYQNTTNKDILKYCENHDVDPSSIYHYFIEGSDDVGIVSWQEYKYLDGSKRVLGIKILEYDEYSISSPEVTQAILNSSTKLLISILKELGFNNRQLSVRLAGK